MNEIANNAEVVTIQATDKDHPGKKVALNFEIRRDLFVIWINWIWIWMVIIYLNFPCR